MSPERANVLVVDDDTSIRTLLATIFTEHGYRVRSAEDGISALVEIQDENPDILVSDLNMPGMSGFDLLSHVHRQYPNIRVIAMSADYSGRVVPPGVYAHFFHAKGTKVESLLHLVEGCELPPVVSPAFLRR
jgi:DNA-binding NtrC family response regulator